MRVSEDGDTSEISQTGISASFGISVLVTPRYFS